MNHQYSYWLYLGSAVLHNEHRISESNFKLSVVLVELIWRKLYYSYPNILSPKHLLWTLHFLKSRNPYHSEIATFLHTNIKTLMQYVMKALVFLLLLLPKCDFYSRFNRWNHRNPSCLVDTTSVIIKQPYINQWEYYNNSKKAYTLQYQVVCSLGKPFRIISFDGPFKGAAADVSIFRDTIKPHLEYWNNETVMADKAYHQDESCWTSPLGPINKLSEEDKRKRREVYRIRHLVERVIGRLTFWGIFKKKWNYDYDLHELCAHVAAKLTNLELVAYPLT
jgi:hypothetical protein